MAATHDLIMVTSDTTGMSPPMRWETYAACGGGITRGDTSAYVDVEFDENTGDVDARLSADHRLSDSSSVRGSVGTDGDDINHLGAGATRTFEGGHRVDGDLNWDRENGVSGEARYSHRRARQ